MLQMEGIGFGGLVLGCLVVLMGVSYGFVGRSSLGYKHPAQEAVSRQAPQFSDTHGISYLITSKVWYL